MKNKEAFIRPALVAGSVPDFIGVPLVLHPYLIRLVLVPLVLVLVLALALDPPWIGSS